MATVQRASNCPVIQTSQPATETHAKLPLQFYYNPTGVCFLDSLPFSLCPLQGEILSLVYTICVSVSTAVQLCASWRLIGCVELFCVLQTLSWLVQPLRDVDEERYFGLVTVLALCAATTRS